MVIKTCLGRKTLFYKISLKIHSENFLGIPQNQIPPPTHTSTPGEDSAVSKEDLNYFIVLKVFDDCIQRGVMPDQHLYRLLPPGQNLLCL